MSDKQGLYDALFENPKDSVAGFALADMLEESGDPRAALYRAFYDGHKHKKLIATQSFFTEDEAHEVVRLARIYSTAGKHMRGVKERQRKYDRLVEYVKKCGHPYASDLAKLKVESYYTSYNYMYVYTLKTGGFIVGAFAAVASSTRGMKYLTVNRFANPAEAVLAGFLRTSELQVNKSGLPVSTITYRVIMSYSGHVNATFPKEWEYLLTPGWLKRK